MTTTISDKKTAMGQNAAERGAEEIRRALRKEGEAYIILATGASQFEMLEHLVNDETIDWRHVTAFHLDEYIGMSSDHEASFRRYLKERFVDRLPNEIRQFHYINAEDEPFEECQRLGEIIGSVNIDVAFIGIGENGHVAFNDPPADFKTEEPYIVVDLDEACRRQQLGEGWFSSLSEVPKKAITMSVRQVLKSETIICTVPDARKADAVKNTLEGPITPNVPASILQEHPECYFFLDAESAMQLEDYA